MSITDMSSIRREFNLRAARSGLVTECPPDGAFNSQIAVVAEAPGDNEVIKKIPLIGGSGHKLWQVMRNIDVSRTDCYVTNVSKRQVSFSSDRRKPMNRHEQETWNNLLLWELSQLPNVKYVVALGNFALEALCGKQGITAWRGSVLPVELPNGRTVEVLCTYNPAMILREPKTEIVFRMDIKKLKRVMNGTFVVPTILEHINPSKKDALEWINLMRYTGKPVSVDIEIIGRETACVGLSNSAEEGMCINFRDLEHNRFSHNEEKEIRAALAETFLDHRVQFVAQNGMFDLTWLWFKDRLKIHSIWFDTMLAHHLLYPTLPHNLGFLTTQYTNHPYYKDEKDDWKDIGDVDAFWRYNVKDVCITHKVASKELAELERQGLDKLFFDHIMKAQPVLARMTVAGVKIDTDLKDRIRQQLIEDVNHKLNEFHKSVSAATGIKDYAPNPKSPAQMSDLFFRKLKLVGRGTSTNADNRKRIYQHPKTSEEAKYMIQKLDDYLVDHKFLTTYADMEIDPDGRARCEYKQTGVQSAPGRLSSSKVMWGSGMNLQNQPSRAYPMFIADEGYGIAYFDMAQAEARLVAYFANIPLWKEQFERARRDGSFDAHRALASDMFGIPYDEVPTDDIDAHGNKTPRFVAKRCRHGLNYRMQAERLAQTAGLTLSEATKAFNLYHRTTPELVPWWRRVEKEIKNNKVIYNAFGRPLPLLEQPRPEALESIIAFKPQSTLGDKVVQVMYQCEDDDEWPAHARMWLNVHDALMAIAPLDKIRTCLKIMKRYAESPILIDGEELIIPADCKESVPDENGFHRWSTLKKVKIEV